MHLIKVASKKHPGCSRENLATPRSRYRVRLYVSCTAHPEEQTSFCDTAAHASGTWPYSMLQAAGTPLARLTQARGTNRQARAAGGQGMPAVHPPTSVTDTDVGRHLHGLRNQCGHAAQIGCEV
jgi:hypothetical protein